MLDRRESRTRPSSPCRAPHVTDAATKVGRPATSAQVKRSTLQPPRHRAGGLRDRLVGRGASSAPSRRRIRRSDGPPDLREVHPADPRVAVADVHLAFGLSDAVRPEEHDETGLELAFRGDVATATGDEQPAQDLEPARPRAATSSRTLHNAGTVTSFRAESTLSSARSARDGWSWPQRSKSVRATEVHGTPETRRR